MTENRNAWELNTTDCPSGVGGRYSCRCMELTWSFFCLSVVPTAVVLAFVVVVVDAANTLSWVS